MQIVKNVLFSHLHKSAQIIDGARARQGGHAPTQTHFLKIYSLFTLAPPKNNYFLHCGPKAYFMASLLAQIDVIMRNHCT